MDPRVLELLKNPKNIQSEDLNLLKEEIHAFPYIQNIRALHLYGVHLYDKENYQKELSVTAAYTTDKKILYQLINGKIQHKPAPEISEEKKSLKPAESEGRYAYKDKGFPIKRDQPTENGVEKQETVPHIPEPPKESKPVFVKGERNRILFEGEENFLDEKNTGTIDLESTLESGTLVIQKQDVIEEPALDEPIVGERAVEKIIDAEEPVSENPQEEFTPETIINEDEIALPSEKEEIKDDSELSFHETETLPSEIADNEEEHYSVEEHVEDQKEVTAAEETDHQTDEVPEEFTAEEIINVSKPSVQEEQKVEEDDAELSFHGMEAFLPDVKIQANTDEIASAEVIQSSTNKHEDEMRRLIEEVEKKMKVAKESVSEPKIEEPETTDHEISFAETQQFHFWSTEKEDKPIVDEVVTGHIEDEADSIETVEAPEPPVQKEELQKVQEEVKSAWKPMSLEAHIPDSLLNKSAGKPEQKIEEPAQEQNIPLVIEKAEDSQIETEPQQQQDNEPVKTEEEPVDAGIENSTAAVEKEKQDEAPVMNVSFFSSDISSLPVSRAEKEEVNEKEEMALEKETVQNILDSNVPGFINTWQSWLKIDRPEDHEEQEPKTEDKIKVIDAFIENNPKISQLREEGSYVIKEKKGDISHLMTETLANLYVEQKLYSKAIKAFEILKQKHPEKTEHFNAKIAHVNDIKSGK
ncbi:hypothetical protein N6B72_06170 [Chryseobacterium soli]|uniref:hypothetical protein n=1 Tax=Chryseobacterium soli TaxID=445961 RepID=UPI0029534BB3|nr:hypothetical protein [Chryseobacterium soli]MDV7696503.1 hypothetical protein [Chryseobacterium soli]